MVNPMMLTLVGGNDEWKMVNGKFYDFDACREGKNGKWKMVNGKSYDVDACREGKNGKW